MFQRFAASLALGLCALAAHAANPQVELKTSLGSIVLELNAAAAPDTTANFIRYVQDGHYDGTIFHRVIAHFMIQGGGMDENLREKQTRAPIENEANNGLKNEIGTVAMARTSAPHSARAQFYINVANNGFLDFRSADNQGWGYAVFGKVIKGMEVVQKITDVKTGKQGMHSDVPRTPIFIESARVIAEPVPEKAPETKPAKPQPASPKKPG